MRVLDANFGGSQHGVFTKRPGTLTNDFFVNLLDMSTAWKPVSEAKDVFEGRDRATGELNGPARASISSSVQTRSSARLRKSMASADAKEQFVHDFVAAWNKVMNLDRFDLA